MVVQKNHVLLRFLKLRLVVNGMLIYPLRQNNPVLVNTPANQSEMVVTDGYHVTPTFLLKHRRQLVHLHVACAVDNDLLVGGLIFMLMFFSMGASSGVLALQVFSLLPVAGFLFLYYIQRKDFIKIRLAYQ